MGAATAYQGALEQYLADISQFKPFASRQEESEDIRLGQAGDMKARERVLHANLKFVYSVAKKLYDEKVGLGDLVNEGNIGLMDAFNTFDADRGIKFISYAVWHIRKHILMALAEQSSTVRVPYGALHLSRKINDLADEISQQQSIPLGKARAIAAKQLGGSVADLRLVKNAQEAASLDAPLRHDQARPLGDWLSDSAPTPVDEVQQRELAYKVNQACQRYISLYPSYGPRDIMAVRLYHGLDDGNVSSQERIGRLLRISRQRVQQCKERVHERLRCFNDLRGLEEQLG